MQAALTVTLGNRFVVTTASTASTGLNRLTAFRPDLVILNASLPDLKSATFLRAIRAHHRECRVIVLTENEESSSLQELLALRVDGFFQRSHDVEVLFHQIYSLLGAASSAALQLAGRRPDRHVGAAIRHVAANYENNLSVEAIARAVGLSTAQLAYLFRRETGMTVKEYVMGVRLEIAKRLLTETNDKLELIAEQAGFCDASHLSRVFRRICGCPPGRYRREGFWTDLNGQQSKLKD